MKGAEYPHLPAKQIANGFIISKIRGDPLFMKLANNMLSVNYIDLFNDIQNQHYENHPYYVNVMNMYVELQDLMEIDISASEFVRSKDIFLMSERGFGDVVLRNIHVFYINDEIPSYYSNGNANWPPKSSDDVSLVYKGI